MVHSWNLLSELESRFIWVMVQIKAPPQLAQSETQAAMVRAADALVGLCSASEFITKPEQFLTSVCYFISVSSETVVFLWVGRWALAVLGRWSWVAVVCSAPALGPSTSHSSGLHSDRRDRHLPRGHSGGWDTGGMGFALPEHWNKWAMGEVVSLWVNVQAQEVTLPLGAHHKPGRSGLAAAHSVRYLCLRWQTCYRLLKQPTSS